MTFTRTYRARPAEEFIDSIGINTHCNYTDTAYGNADKVVEAMRYLGIRHARDLLKSSHNYAHALQRRLNTDLGVKFSFVMDYAGRYVAGTPQQQIAALKDPAKVGGLAALLEGENERDFDGVNQDDVDRQEALYDLVRADPALDHLPLIGPSWARGSTSVPSWDGFGQESVGHEDAWNLHPYAGGEAPDAEDTTGQFGEPQGSIASRVSQAKSLENQPVYATECGYHDAVNGDGRGHHPASQRAITAYLVRMYLEHFRLGIVRSYAYELVDQKPEPALVERERRFGLFNNDFTPKPYATALRNLVAATRDPSGKTATSRDVSVTVTGDDSLRVLPLTRGDGVLVLALWRPIPLQDTGGANPPQIADAPRDVSVEVAGFGTTGAVRVGAQPQVFALQPTGATTPPPPAPEPEPEPPVAGQVLIDVGTSVNDGGYLLEAVAPTGLSAGAGTGVFASVRYGKSLTWALPAPAGAFVVVDLVETATFAPGQRVFDLVTDAGTTRVDLSARFGVKVAGSLGLGQVPARADGKVYVTAKGVVENAVVAGIRFVPAESTVEPPVVEPEPEPDPTPDPTEALEQENHLLRATLAQIRDAAQAALDR